MFAPGIQRAAIIGDIGGQATVFQHVMSDLGADPDTLALPAGLAAVQVGDLVRAGVGTGLDNDACVRLAARAAAANPGRWVQLWGNHDLAVLGGPCKPSWLAAPQVTSATRERLRRWWEHRHALLAIGLRSRELGDVLVSHAGLTRGRWQAIAGPRTPAAAADLLNRDVGQPVARVIHGGSLTGTDPGADAAGADVTWAEVVEELYRPWLAAGDMPFNQIHGHAAPWNWSTQDWWPTMTQELRAATTVDPATRRTTIFLTDSPCEQRLAVSVDWMLGDAPASGTWPPLTVALA